MIYSKAPLSPSFSARGGGGGGGGDKGTVVQDSETLVEAGLWMGLGQC